MAQRPGPNTVISMLHHQLLHITKEKVVRMHANNCVGQNKNKTVMAYLCWRTITGLSDEMSLSFMRVGHTRCSVDAKFGRLKQSYRKSDVDTMDDVVRSVAESCAANIPLRFCWEWFKWDEFLSASFKAIPGIRQHQHFRAVKSKPGSIFVKASCSAEEKEIKLLRPDATPRSVVESGMPDVLPCAGISDTRMSYLEHSISDFIAQAKIPPWCDVDVSPAME